MLRTIRITLWATAAVVAFIGAAIGLGWWQESARGPETAADRSFQMTDHTGKAVTEADFKGKPTILFFGFLSCPDVCPTTLADIGGWLEALGSEAGRLNAVLVTVDPKRDTPEALAEYLSSFDPRIRGLTGTDAQLSAMGRNYGFFYAPTPLEGGDYTMQHTSSVFLLDAELNLVATIDYHEDRKVVMPKLRRLLDS